MPLKSYDTKDAVPEALRATAVETKEGKFVVSEDPAPLGDAGKKALDAERTAKEEAEKRAKKAEDDLAALKRTAEAREKGVTEEQLKQIRDDEEKKRKPLEEENAQLKAKNRKLARDDRLRAAGLKAGWLPDRVEKAMKDLDGRVDLTEDEKDFLVKDVKGAATSEKLDDFLGKTYKAEAPFFYAGSGGAGGGSDGSQGGGGGDADLAKAKTDGKARADQQKAVAGASSLALR